MFELDRQPAKLTSVNPRAELHGDQTMPAVDLGFSFDTSNHILTMFGSQLRASLFAKTRPKDAPPGDQPELDGISASDLPHVRNPAIDGAVRIRWEGVGYAASIAFGINDDSALALHLIKVGKVRVTPMEGGSVTVTLRLQVTDPDEHTVGRLARMVGETVDLTIKAPQADEPGPIR